MSKAVKNQPYSLIPTTLNEAMEFAKIIADGNLVPKEYRGKPGDVMVAMQMGADLGLAPMQAIQNIAVINGRPCVWGDALLAIVKAHPQFESIQEYEENEVAICKIKRRNQPENIATFSKEDAIRAGLANKQGPWRQYPKRMRQLRARSFALRDAFPDALRGIQMAEEVRDYVDVTPVEERQPVAVTQHASTKTELIKGKLGIAPPVKIGEENTAIEHHKQNGSEITLPLVESKIEAATNSAELKAAAEMAVLLADSDKAIIREIYRKKNDAFKAAV